MLNDLLLIVWLWYIQTLKSFCSHKLECLTIKCRPYYLPREFSSVIVTAVYILPQADAKTALKELRWNLCKLENTYPEAAFIVAGDFNKANLRKRLLKSYQDIDCSTRTAKTLDHCYTTFQNAYTALYSANRTTIPSCSSPPIGRHSNRKHPW